eukprot:gene22096-biopygen7781
MNSCHEGVRDRNRAGIEVDYPERSAGSTASVPARFRGADLWQASEMAPKRGRGVGLGVQLPTVTTPF